MNPATIRTVVLTDCIINLEEFIAVVRYNAILKFSSDFCKNVYRSRKLIKQIIDRKVPVYGITTGFGDNVHLKIPLEEMKILQKNIIRSHACSIGEPLSREGVRAIMLMSILNAGKGYSGIRLEVLELIKDFLNRGITPFAPSEGSVGYLSVEAHIALTYIGEGRIYSGYCSVSSLQVLKEYKLEPLELEYKEGLTLLNGTLSVTALSLLACYDAGITMSNIEIAGALCYEALKGSTKALDARVHNNKKHKEQQESAKILRVLLHGSELCNQSDTDHVQDALLLRAMPQVHGATLRLLNQAEKAIVEEMHSVSDNPEIFDTADGLGIAIMCGNFDGTYVGSHADIISMACAIIGNQVERGIDRIVNRNLNNGLPAFLTPAPGLNNGFMIHQYTAAGLQNELKLLAIPSSIDSISTCAGQEDPVSMAYNATTRAVAAVRKLQYLVAIEIIVALQAIDLRTPLKQGRLTKKIHDFVRKTIDFADQDRFFGADIEAMRELVKKGALIELIDNELVLLGSKE